MAGQALTARKVLVYWMDGAVALLALTLMGMVVTAFAEGTISVPHAVAAGACLAGTCGLFPFLLREAFDTRPAPSVRLVLAGLLAVGALALVPPATAGTGDGMWAMVMFLWLSAAVLYLPLWAAWCTGAVVLALTTATVALLTRQPWQPVLLVQAITAVLMSVAMWLWRWLWWTIRDAHDGKEAKASLAVAEERLRFARDLHDLLGHSLSVISLKSELAAKLATRAAAEGKAAREMADVRRLAVEALAEVQVAVDGYRTLDLDEELDGVRAALEAAGARCEIDAATAGLSPGARVLLAWAVREGATNVLKHSAATRCSITIRDGALEMRNDGVRVPAEPRGAGGGSGLRGLAERLAAAGGAVTAGPGPAGEFVLKAVVPA
ncbi:sensor histidine kinase [Nonomuraea rhodomycinica]|uniref:sensor histidine kinase n=1 Tax=Nonomuraea rhodomycinica TaxID=1712872 RepID=UPI001C37C0A0|nr:histidine kinase [Nonomuraea rhodomycinica]